MAKIEDSDRSDTRFAEKSHFYLDFFVDAVSQNIGKSAIAIAHQFLIN